MGIFDLPAALDFVSKKTARPGEIIYIGHSMGTTMFFVYSSIYKNAKDTVQKMVGLAPAAYMGHVRSVIKYLAPFANNLEVNNHFLSDELIFKIIITHKLCFKPNCIDS